MVMLQVKLSMSTTITRTEKARYAMKNMFLPAERADAIMLL